MLIEGLGSVTFVNGILRVQTIAVAANGEATETGNLEIPGNKVGDVINALNQAATDISDKLGGDNDDKSSKDKSKSDTKKNKKK
ncbi:MAG: hypothetical protein VX775_00775 [Pseudomonadota bacterium]|nr:hypothetical protein [Pseudomonadota bacterium]